MNEKFEQTFPPFPHFPRDQDWISQQKYCPTGRGLYKISDFPCIPECGTGQTPVRYVKVMGKLLVAIYKPYRSKLLNSEKIHTLSSLNVTQMTSMALREAPVPVLGSLQHRLRLEGRFGSVWISTGCFQMPRSRSAH